MIAIENSFARLCKPIAVVCVLYLGCMTLGMALGNTHNDISYDAIVTAYNNQ